MPASLHHILFNLIFYSLCSSAYSPFHCALFSDLLLPQSLAYWREIRPLKRAAGELGIVVLWEGRSDHIVLLILDSITCGITGMLEIEVELWNSDTGCPP